MNVAVSRYTWTKGDVVIQTRRTAGGSGSGNFGHSGRPGTVGGSGGTGDPSFTPAPRWDIFDRGSERKGMPADEGYGRTEIASHVNHRLIDGDPLTDEQQRALDQVEYEQSKHKMEGDHIVFHGGRLQAMGVAAAFISTSTDRATTKHFGSGQIVAIQVPKGTHIAYGDSVEQEIILPRGGSLAKAEPLADGTPVLRYTENSEVKGRLDAVAAKRKIENDREMERYLAVKDADHIPGIDKQIKDIVAARPATGSRTAISDPPSALRTLTWVYILRDPVTDEPRYVGCTTNPTVRFGNQADIVRWVRELRPLRPRIDVVREFDFLSHGLTYEKQLIRQLRKKHRLLNKTPGGEHPDMHTERRQVALAKFREELDLSRRLYPELGSDGDFHSELLYNESSITRTKQALERFASVFALDPEARHKGLLVSLQLDIDASESLYVPGGEDPAGMHITLAYCGDASDLGDVVLARAIAGVSDVALYQPPLSGCTTYPDFFPATPQSDGNDVIISRVDVPGLRAFRDALTTVLTDAGAPPRSDHSEYVPHITLKYVPKGTSGAFLVKNRLAIPSVPLSFDAVDVSVGEAKTSIPLGN